MPFYQPFRNCFLPGDLIYGLKDERVIYCENVGEYESDTSESDTSESGVFESGVFESGTNDAHNNDIPYYI